MGQEAPRALYFILYGSDYNLILQAYGLARGGAAIASGIYVVEICIR